ncbi:hypothetical protein ACE3MQ_10785 [Paenibacillus lentus]
MAAYCLTREGRPLAAVAYSPTVAEHSPAAVVCGLTVAGCSPAAEAYSSAKVAYVPIQIVAGVAHKGHPGIYFDFPAIAVDVFAAPRYPHSLLLHLTEPSKLSE